MLALPSFPCGHCPASRTNSTHIFLRLFTGLNFQVQSSPLLDQSPDITQSTLPHCSVFYSNALFRLLSNMSASSSNRGIMRKLPA